MGEGMWTDEKALAIAIIDGFLRLYVDDGPHNGPMDDPDPSMSHLSRLIVTRRQVIAALEFARDRVAGTYDLAERMADIERRMAHLEARKTIG